LPVSKHGLLLGIIDLTTKGHIIKVEAADANGSKEIVRDFTVED
jgi:hypothetical protein